MCPSRWNTRITQKMSQTTWKQKITCVIKKIWGKRDEEEKELPLKHGSRNRERQRKMRVLGRHHGHDRRGLEEQELFFFPKNKKKKEKGKERWREGWEVGLRDIMMYLHQTMGTAGRQQRYDLWMMQLCGGVACAILFTEVLFYCFCCQWLFKLHCSFNTSHCCHVMSVWKPSRFLEHLDWNSVLCMTVTVFSYLRL